MEFMQAVAAHIRLNRKLSSYVARPDHSLKAPMVGAPDGCELGRWIAGEASRYSSVPEFTQLIASHARFHRAAAEISRADSGQAKVQETAFDSTSEFDYASSGVVRALMFLYGKIGEVTIEA